MSDDTIKTYGRDGLKQTPRWYLLKANEFAPERLTEFLCTGQVEYRSAYVDDDLASVLVRTGPLAARRRIRPGLCLPIDPEMCRRVLEGLEAA